MFFTHSGLIKAVCIRGFMLATMAIMGATAPAFATETQVAIVGNHADEAAELTGGEIAGDRSLRIQVSLALRNRDELEKLIAEQQDASSPLYHQWLTTAEFNDRFGPGADDIAKVEAWLSTNGFSVESVSVAGRNLVASAPASVAEKTFAVKIATSTDGKLFANVNDPTVPASIAPLVGSIRGLGNTLHLKNNLVVSQTKGHPDVTENGRTAFGPKDLLTFYDGTSLNSLGTMGLGADCIALVESSDVEDAAIAFFDATFGLPTATLTRVLADGTNPGTVGGGSSLIESELDVEYSHSTAPGAAITLYLGKGANALVDTISRAVSDNACGVISVSFEFCGQGPSFYTGTIDPMFMQAESQGQAVFVASGDDGAAGLKATSNGCVIAPGVRKVSELAADPHVTAVGGTQFTATFNNGNDVGYATESVWHDTAPIPAAMRGASGGGVSSIFAKPSFQSGIFPTSKRRNIPDVSFAASPSHPGFFLSTGSPPTIACCIGGTSLGAPVWAGLSALAAQSAGTKRVGNINAKIYSLGPSRNTSSSGLHDVTQGNNGLAGAQGFQAKPGYDRATGWGTPDIGILVPMLRP
jgi:kumamolisin